MRLDDLLTDEEPEPPRPEVRRRRALVIGVAAVLGAALVGVAAGVVAGLVDGGSTSRVAAVPGPSSTPSPVPSSPSPGAPSPTASGSPTATPRATASVDVPASGRDVGYLVGGSRVGDGQGDGRVVAEVRFDRVQVLTGAEAEAAAQRDGAEVTGDDYVVNDNPRLRTLQLLESTTVTGDASFAAWAGDGRSGRHPRTVDELLRFVGSPQGRETLFDVRYDGDGFVASLVERYQP